MAVPAPLIPAKAGIQGGKPRGLSFVLWVPAFAGTSGWTGLGRVGDHAVAAIALGAIERLVGALA